ncbi:unannotated protein [freshwater metagenome]|uniref:Unannotated protein n=1 Tax=freshwater metagenome TaxID=449393 RepID=A0A6J6HQ06_9ZZZZ
MGIAGLRCRNAVGSVSLIGEGFVNLRRVLVHGIERDAFLAKQGLGLVAFAEIELHLERGVGVGAGDRLAGGGSLDLDANVHNRRRFIADNDLKSGRHVVVAGFVFQHLLRLVRNVEFDFGNDERVENIVEVGEHGGVNGFGWSGCWGWRAGDWAGWGKECGHGQDESQNGGTGDNLQVAISHWLLCKR